MQDVIIHSKFVTDYPTVSALYYYIKGVAKDNCGYAWLDLTVASAFFSKSPKTIQRWIKKGLQIGAFQETRKDGSKYFIKLKAFKVFETEVLEWSFAAAKIPFSELGDQKALKAKAYAIALQGQQLRTEGQIDLKVKNSKKIFNPRKVSDARKKVRASKRMASKTVAGFPSYGRGENFFVNSNTQAYGSSQISVAHQLNRSRQTVMRHTRDLERVKMWRRVLGEDVVAHYTFFNYKTGREENYERLPNYYPSINLDVRHRGTNPNKRFKSKLITDQNERDVQYILSLKKPRRLSLEDKLIDLTEDQLRRLACDICWFLKGMEIPAERLAALNPIEILFSTARLADDGSCSKDELAFISFLIKTIKANRTLRRSTSWEDLMLQRSTDYSVIS